MKNKGFTLVELLAVIVVLSIIALIGYSTVGNIISSTQDNSNKITMENYAKAVNQAVFLYEMNNSDSTLPELNSNWLKENVKFEKATVECEYATYNKTSSLYGCTVNNSDKTYCYTGATAVECTPKGISKIYGESIQNGTPTPTSPVEIQSVGEKSTNLIPFNYTSRTKNGVTITVNNDGSLTYNGTATASVSYELFNGKMSLVEGKKYYFSDCYVQLNGQSGNIMTNGYTAKSGDYISLIWIWNASGTTFNNEIKRPMLSNSTITDSDYEHPGYKIPITISNGTETKTTNIYLKEPLRKIGEYADYLDLTNKKVVRNVRRYNFTGSESWTADYAPTLVFSISDVNKGIVNTKILCNVAESSLDQKVIGYANSSGNAFQFKDAYSKFEVSNLAEFKEKLGSLNIYMLYLLAKPTEESIDVPEIPSLPEGQNCEDFYKVDGTTVACGY